MDLVGDFLTASFILRIVGSGRFRVGWYRRKVKDGPKDGTDGTDGWGVFSAAEMTPLITLAAPGTSGNYPFRLGLIPNCRFRRHLKHMANFNARTKQRNHRAEGFISYRKFRRRLSESRK